MKQILLMIALVVLAGCEQHKSRLESAEELKNRAKKGDARAQGHLGFLYDIGSKEDGIEKNYKEAVRWYRKAALQEDAMARFELGRIYTRGAVVEKDEKEAIK